MTSPSLQDGVSGLVKRARDDADRLRTAIQRLDDQSTAEADDMRYTQACFEQYADAMEALSHQSVGVDDAMIDRAYAAWARGNHTDIRQMKARFAAALTAALSPSNTGEKT